MSDLAPFVAAVLRDKTVMELLAELKAEKEKSQRLEKELRTIKITGKGGFPVYAQRHFQFSYEDVAMPGEWDIGLQNSTFDDMHENAPEANPSLSSCPVQDIENCEIHIGGSEIVNVKDFENTDSLSSVGDTKTCI